MIQRTSLIVYFRSPKAVKQIEKIANVTYYHKKRRYAVCYVNQDELEATMEKMKKLRLVKRVEESLFDTEAYEIEL